MSDTAIAPTPTTQASPQTKIDVKPSSEPSGFDALDAKAAPKAKEPAKTPEPGKDTSKDKDKPADGKEVKPDAAKPDDKKPGEISVGPKALREKLEKTEKERDEFSRKVADYEKRIASAEKNGGDTTALTERLAKIEKDHTEAQATIRALRSEASPEFKDKYDKPFNNAAERAAKFINQLEIYDMVDDGTGTGTMVQKAVRKADWKKEFTRLYQLDYAEAKTAAKKLFGEEAGQVMNEWQKLHDLDDARSSALQEERANFETKEKEAIAERSKRVEFYKSSFTKVTEDIASRNPHFQERPDDAEGNELLKEGYRLVDSAMLNGDALTPDQKIASDAHIRHRAAAHTRMSRDNRILTERVAELEAKLKEKGDVDPGDVRRGAGGGSDKPEKSLSEELREVLA